MSEELVTVEGHPDLSRTTSHAIVNTSKTDYELFLERKRSKLKDLERIDTLETKVENIEDKLDAILELLQRNN